LEYIESYFKDVHSDAEKQQFERKIIEDPSFAEDVAFYISANGVIQQELHAEKKKRFRDLLDEQKVIPVRAPVRNLWRYMAAASVIFVVFLLSWFLFVDKTSPQQLADKYVQQNLQTLSVSMGSSQDSLQAGINLFNLKNLTAASTIFETLAKNDPSNRDAEKYAGVVFLRLKDYDKALQYFSMLEADTTLFSNPGKFYKAITLMERNKKDDRQAAKVLLQQVIAEDMEGSSEAAKWMKSF
jgi:tetratricopeptide (TPR) repeat protein